MFQTDTIAAIATAMSNAGIGIIRISGPDAISIVDSVFRGKRALTEMESHTVSYGHIVAPAYQPGQGSISEIYSKEIGQLKGSDREFLAEKNLNAEGKNEGERIKDEEGDRPVDEVLVSIFRAPRTYTREDVVEINCHGGILILQEILQLLFSCGARPAEPGEFTKRAFLNGRIDMAQAESVMDLIHAQSELAVRNSLEQLSGVLSRCIKEMREKLLYEIAFIESALDDPEHYDLDGHSDHLKRSIENIAADLRRLLDSSKEGSYLRDGILTAIVGRPNAGKSSLLNALAGRERAIVTDIPGTTRDTLEEKVRLGHVTLQLIDTAGIRESEDRIEQIGVERARKSMEQADLIIFVMDASRPLDDEDRKMLKQLSSCGYLEHSIILLNKMDLTSVLSAEQIQQTLPQMNSERILSVSVRREEGLGLLASVIEKMFFRGQIQENQQIFITNARHKYALEEAKKALDLVLEGMNKHIPEDFLTVDLMSCYEQLGLITGETLEDDLADEIFSKFCMGK